METLLRTLLVVALLNVASSDEPLKEVFKSFCAFGAGTAEPLMDNAKFGKLFRDLKLYDKKFTSTDTDIIFNRPEVKGKTERKIDFNQFKTALELCAEKKYGSKGDVQKLIDEISAGATTSGTDRVIYTSKYAGKEGFDESGKGKGTEGRQDFDSKAGKGYVGGHKR